MIKIHLLEQLTTFAELGTLSAAAKRLHTSQPALTRSMKKLEDDLGVSLFMRKKNHLKLNETGLHAAEYARRVLEADKDFETRVRAFDRSLHTLSIGFCAPVPQTVLTPLINSIFEGMTISSDMTDDAGFLKNWKTEPTSWLSHIFCRKVIFFTAKNADMKIFLSHWLPEILLHSIRKFT